MMARRKIAVFTGNRAEYGLLSPVLRAISAEPRLQLQLLVSGAHLDPQFGRTLSEIEKDGFDPGVEVKINMPEDTLYGTALAIGSGIASVADALRQLKPDIFVVYADRFEGFAAVIAGTQMGIPTAHIEGGDRTEGGALDDSVRHAMTKLAHLHFTTNEEAAIRVRAMGEEQWRVHNVGFPAIDLIASGRFASSDEVVARYGLSLNFPVVLFTQHSVTIEAEEAVNQIKPSLQAISRLAKDGHQIILTYPNNDAGGRRIIAELDAFVAAGHPGVQIHPSLGRHNYYGILALARDPANRVVCAGNSSSGIKETPAFSCPAVNIGTRQLNRLRANNVIDAGYDAAEVEVAIRRGLFDEDFRAICRSCHNPYGEGNSGQRIAAVLAGVELSADLLRKRMTVLGETRDGWFR